MDKGIAVNIIVISALNKHPAANIITKAKL